MNVAMILAGGNGTRMHREIPKQFIEILGKPVLAYTIDIFQSHPQIEVIGVVCRKEWIGYCREMIQKYGLTKVRWIVPGGSTFQESVLNGVNYMRDIISGYKDIYGMPAASKENDAKLKETDYAVIQYGAAPFTSHRIVDAVLEMARTYGSAVSGTPCYQLLSVKDTDHTSVCGADRDQYIQIACPYSFQISYLLDIYKRAQDQGLIDVAEPHTTSLMYALGDTVHFAYGDQTNIKITTDEDLGLFEGYVLMKKRNRLDSKDESDDK